MRLAKLRESASLTLKMLQQDTDARDGALQAKGFKGSGDAPRPATFGPTNVYPLPWFANQVDPQGIFSVWSANGKEIVTWINRTDANKIIDEVNGTEELLG